MICALLPNVQRYRGAVNRSTGGSGGYNVEAKRHKLTVICWLLGALRRSQFAIAHSLT